MVKERTVRTTLVVIILIAVSGCGAPSRYEYKVNLPKDVYTQPIDPNDQAYNGLVQMSPVWEKTYGPSERSLLLFNWNVLRTEVVGLRTLVIKNKEGLEVNQKGIETLKEREDEEHQININDLCLLVDRHTCIRYGES